MSFPRGIVDIDGVLTRPEDARVSVFDRGVLYGDSAFEALRTYGKRGFHHQAHLERLARSCERLHIALPLPLAELSARVNRAVAASGLPECYLRIVVTRGVGPLGLDTALGRTPCVIVYALELKLPAAEQYERGITVGLVHTVRTVDGTPAAGAKASNYLASLLALDQVKASGASEVLIVDGAGNVLEGATSNVFVVQAGVLITPPLSAGILEGITRRTVMAIARGLGVRCEERALRPGDLERADEVFITSSIRELVPVVKVGDATIANGKPGPLCASLLAAYRAEASAP